MHGRIWLFGFDPYFLQHPPKELACRAVPKWVFSDCFSWIAGPVSGSELPGGGETAPAWPASVAGSRERVRGHRLFGSFFG